MHSGTLLLMYDHIQPQRDHQMTDLRDTHGNGFAIDEGPRPPGHQSQADALADFLRAHSPASHWECDAGSWASLRRYRANTGLRITQYEAPFKFERERRRLLDLPLHLQLSYCPLTLCWDEVDGITRRAVFTMPAPAKSAALDLSEVLTAGAWVFARPGIAANGDPVPLTLKCAKTKIPVLTPAIQHWLKHIGAPTGNIRLAGGVDVTLTQATDVVTLVPGGDGYLHEISRTAPPSPPEVSPAQARWLEGLGVASDEGAKTDEARKVAFKAAYGVGGRSDYDRDTNPAPDEDAKTDGGAKAAYGSGTMAGLVQAQAATLSRHLSETDETAKVAFEEAFGSPPVEHFVHKNMGGGVFVKEGQFFRDQKGMTAEWGQKWTRVYAVSIEHARLLAQAPDFIFRGRDVAPAAPPAVEPTPRSEYLDIVCARPPGRDSTFIGVENDQGKSVKLGKWVERSDGYWVLRIDTETFTKALSK